MVLIVLWPLWGLCASSYTAVQLHKVEIGIKNLSYCKLNLRSRPSSKHSQQAPNENMATESGQILDCNEQQNLPI